MQWKPGWKTAVSAMLLVTVAWIPPCAGAGDPDPAAHPAYLERARSALRSSQPVRALAILEEHREPAVGNVLRAEYFGLACRARVEGGDPAGARTDCEKAIESNSSRSRWRDYNNLGVAEFRLGHETEARSALERAALLSGRVYTPRKNLAIIDSAQQAGASRADLAAALVAR